MSQRNEDLVYQFSDFSVDVTRRHLLRGGDPVQLTSKAFDTLLILIKYRGSTVSKSELMNAIWADTAVEENNLTKQISALRRALGERPDDHAGKPAGDPHGLGLGRCSRKRSPPAS